MSVFWILAGIMIIGTLFALLAPLLGNKSADRVDRQHLNISLIREQYKRLKQDFADGLIDDDTYQTSREELELSLVEELPENEQQKVVPAAKSKVLSMFLIALIPFSSLIIYHQLGSPDLLANPPIEQPTQADVESMVDGLAARLENTPDDLEGWSMLGKSYMIMRRFEEAKEVFANLLEKKPDDTSLLLSYADASAMLANGRFEGEPYEIIKKILTQDPEHVQARWIAGMAEQQAGNATKALEIWKPLLTDLQQQSPELAAELKRMIDTVDPEVNETASTEDTQDAVKISVKIAIDASILPEVSDSDTLFVYARAMQGPPMPLAIQRYNAGAIPAEIVLDDTTAMMPAMQLSNFSEVKVDARISKTGSATPQPGDFYGRIENITVENSEILSITIDSVVE